MSEQILACQKRAKSDREHIDIIEVWTVNKDGAFVALQIASYMA